MRKILLFEHLIHVYVSYKCINGGTTVKFRNWRHCFVLIKLKMEGVASQERKHHQLEILKSIFKELNVGKLNLSQESKENVRTYRNFILVHDFLQLDRENTILGLSSECPITLTYTEKKALKQYIEETLETKYKPLVEFVKERDAENPFESEKKLQNKLEEKVAERRELTQRYLDLKAKKLELLKTAAEKRSDSSSNVVLNNLLETAKTKEQQAKFFGKVVTHELINSTEHSKKAIKIVENNLDELIERKKLAESNK